jgi:DNA-binding transcriptional LysR family regulator
VVVVVDLELALVQLHPDYLEDLVEVLVLMDLRNQ